MSPPERFDVSTRMALLMHGALGDPDVGKMGYGLLRYSPATITCVIDARAVGGSVREITGIDTDVPVVASVPDALALGVDVVVIAVAPFGGALPDGYRDEILAALRAGASVVNGLHLRLGNDPEFTDALAPGTYLWDIRTEPEGLENGTGRARELGCRRVLTVGTDMAVGKMTTSLEMDREATRRGLRSHFVATGQIGMCISGDGVPLDAIRLDFASGAVEGACLRQGTHGDVLWIEGQGSILHPSSTAWLALLRGAVPTDLVLVHRAGQRHLELFDEFPIPPLPEVIDAYEHVAAANTAFGSPKVRAVALNCRGLDAAAAETAVREVADATGLPTADPLRNGAVALVDAVLPREG